MGPRIAGAADWTLERSAGHADVRLTGEIDLASEEGLGQLMKELDDPSSVDLDLSGVSFMDSTGIHFLVRMKREIEARGGTFTIGHRSSVVDHVLDLMGLSAELDAQSLGV